MKRVNLPFAVLAAALLLVAVVADPATAVIWELDCDSGAVFTWQAIVTDSVGDPIPSGDYELIYCYYEDSAGLNLIGCCTTIATVGTPSPGLKDDKAALGGSALATLTYAQPIWEDTTKVGHFPKATAVPDVWLELTFNGEVMSPLTLVTSVPNAGTAERMVGDLHTAPGRALILEGAPTSSGMVDILGNDTVASVALYRPTDDILPMMIMEVTDTTSILAVFDTSRNTTISITGDGAGTFEGLVWSKTGFKFPDLTIQTTAWTGGSGCWVCPANYTYLADSTDSVGIGTTSPGEKLEVSGNLRVTGQANIGILNGAPGGGAFVAGGGNDATGDSTVVVGGNSNLAETYYCAVLGGLQNATRGQYAVVGGGYLDTSKAVYGGVFSGYSNLAGDDADDTAAYVGSGYDNSATAKYTVVAGGASNTASGPWCTISGGDFNTASGHESTIGGGYGHTTAGVLSTIGGGMWDTTYALYGGVFSGLDNLAGDGESDTGAFVGGGIFNEALAEYSSVSGGISNTASGIYGTVAGGANNTASGLRSAVGGGHRNTASNEDCFVGGGFYNAASANGAAVGGGTYDTSKAVFGAVFSGYTNLAGDETTDTAAYVGGGYNNSATAKYATVGGGRNNSALNEYSVVGGGRSNTASGNNSTVAGGISNTASGDTSTICGGWYNTADTSHSAISGGYNNTASGFASFVGGGWSNTASGTGSNVVGGALNTTDNNQSTVCGGSLNTASGSQSIVGAGGQNTASGHCSVIGGGYQNGNAGDYSAISVGYRDTLTSSADYSMAFGVNVYVNASYRVVFFDGDNSGRFGLNRDDHDGGISFPIHVGDTTTNGNGAYLSAGGAWSDGSSREFKENFQQLDGKEVLNRIDNLPMESWEYKGTGERHIWPCAEDFHEQFDVGVIKEDGVRDTRYLAAGDVAGVALAGVKELAKENRELRERIVQLEALVEALLAQQDGSNEPKAEFGMNK